MNIVFCADPLDGKHVDSMYKSEADAARSLSIDYHLVDLEALVSGAPERAVRHVPQQDVLLEAIYRGWMLKPHLYQQLYDVLLTRGFQLINDPKMYTHTHYLPESYPIIASYTPVSVWLPHDESFTMEDVHRALVVFGDQPIIIKDYVKSQKHYWYDACYIPNASDRSNVERIVQNFLELQGDDLNEGLVFREFIDFEPLSQHSRSGMPLTKEFRVFVLDKRPIFTTKYWSEGQYRDTVAELDQFKFVFEQVNSRFFTMDIAKRTNGQWMIVELGDGQVAGLPAHADISAFYRALVR